MFETIRIETDPRGVAHLWLAREDKHNALSAQMIRELTQAAAQLGADPAVRVVVLAAMGKSFCAGGDLGWMQEQMRADAATRRAGARELAMMLNALNTLPKPLIGRVQGNAFGGGVGMISVCDVAVSVPEARFGLTETKLGLIPATIGPYVIRAMGPRASHRYFLTAERFSAAEARRIGFVHEVVPADQLDATVSTWVQALLAASPNAIKECKKLVQYVADRDITRLLIDHTVKAIADIRASDEGKEGVQSFLNKRKPAWMVNP